MRFPYRMSDRLHSSVAGQFLAHRAQWRKRKPDVRAPRLCVLIDADNVPAGHAEAIFEECASLGKAMMRRIHGDWPATSLGGWAKKGGGAHPRTGP